ncbi:collagen type III alpha [Nocardia transvalensis]|uniref:Collagen type III alpha n=1 Tax=Nocardia transvalensis TaxID=37333 RepID=A0A7W9PCH2_9NOCA|nr:HIRAN domain-containing protein [Nocardia transvalensis]MBB5913587.1 collagen type III alpha [Nocardia transvalensis]
MAGQPFVLWGKQTWHGQEVVGESHYVDAIRRLFVDGVDEEWTELTATADLVPEPGNPHDSNAVKVVVAGALVGYLPRQDAARYAPVLSTLVSNGLLPQTSARVIGSLVTDLVSDRWGRLTEQKRFACSVQLALAEPDLLVPANMPPPERYVLLPEGRAIQVTGEEAYVDRLAPLLGSSAERWIYVTLHEVTEQLARSSRIVVEVRVDGEPAGRLTPKMSGELLPAIRHFTERDLATAARAILKGNHLKVDVVLQVVRAGELSAEWLAEPPISQSNWHPTASGATETAEPQPSSSALATTVTATSTGWRFNPPPGWPAPPTDWVPPPGWQIPPGMPPVPEGWQWWVPSGR